MQSNINPLNQPPTFNDLISAISNNDPNEVRRILERKVLSVNEINQSNEHGFLPLTIASELGNPEIVEMLLEVGARVNHLDDNDNSAIYKACEEGHDAIVELLIQYGADVNSINEENRTPLICASMDGHLSIAKRLLRNEAHVNHGDARGLTALHLAANNNHYETLVELIKNKADVNRKTNFGQTPLSVAIDSHIYRDESCIDTIKFLIMANSDINSCDFNGDSILIVLVRELRNRIKSLPTRQNISPEDIATETKQIEDKILPIIELLVQSGCDILIKNNKGETATCVNTHPVVDLMFTDGLLNLKDFPEKIKLKAEKALARKFISEELQKDNTQFVIDTLLKSSLESLKILKTNLKDAKNFDMLSSVVNEVSEVLPLLAAQPEYIQHVESFDKAANQIRKVAAIMGDETAGRIVNNFSSYDEEKEAPKMLFSSTPYIRIESDDEVAVEEKKLSPRPIH